MDSKVLVDTPPLQEGMRPQPKGITLLLPVWGYRFVSQFLEFCLPTLLAPGNVPAVAAALPTRFIVLTREDDEELIHSHPTWLALKRVCDAEVEFIDDMITEGNHTTTITLAFARVVRRAHEEKTDTCFVFLMSDYLFADGSLRTVVNHFLNGASGIVAGNFQIVAEEASSSLPYSTDPVSRALTLSSRELLAWSLDYLHPATAANVVNFGLSHNAHTNRLLWRVDENTFIGRFYLIHPIGIRPEVVDFIVGSSLDYSFIPEMCPSGSVVTLTDSDDYFVVEMQPRRHESTNLRPGPIDEAELATSLSEWTTVQHRANADQTVVYHVGDIPENLPQAIAEADAFIGRVSALLSETTPQPWRNHPYWVGAIASNRLQTGQELSPEDWRFLLGEAIPSGGLRSFILRTRRRIFGSPPDVTRFDTRWPDYNLPLKALQEVLSGNGKLLLVTDQPIAFGHWLAASKNEICTVEWDRLVHSGFGRMPDGMPEWYRRLLDSFDACLFVVNEPILITAGRVIDRLSPLLKAKAQISVMVINDRPYHNAVDFRHVFAQSSQDLLDFSSWMVEVNYVPATRLRWLIYRSCDHVLNRLRLAYKKAFMLPVWGCLFFALGVATYFVNSGIRSTKSPPPGLWSSVFLMLRRSQRDSRRERKEAAFSGPVPRTVSPRPKTNRPAPDGGDDTPLASTKDAKSGYIAVATAHTLAGKILAGRPDVAIYGLNDQISSELPKFNVKQLTVYDPGLRVQEARPHKARSVWIHDILSAPLPKLHGAICSLGPLVYVSRVDEDAYVGNLAASLGLAESILILGSPCEAIIDEVAGRRNELLRMVRAEPAINRTTQVTDLMQTMDIMQAIDLEPAIKRIEHAADDTMTDSALSKNSYEGRICLRSGSELKALAERFFYNVFLFSVKTGALFPGFLSSADYVVVLCCQRKILSGALPHV
jgi:hypothetical protein